MLEGESKKMKCFLVFLIGGSLAHTVLGWTYHYSSTTLNWDEARQWCKDNYTDMVVIQNQNENDFLVSLLPERNGTPYYWIGIRKDHNNVNWTWIGNNSTWIGNDSWALNEPNSKDIADFCVEIYVKSGSNRGKWNDEKCARLKYPVCFQAQCNATICGRGRCEETINDFICVCEPGFEGDRCQTVMECNKDEVSAPWKGSVSCNHSDYGYYTYDTVCQYSCEQGYRLSAPAPLRCTAFKTWSEPPPTCECLPDVTCGIDGVWNGPRPVCTSYKHALLTVAGCGAFTACCCTCSCWMKQRKRKKLAQVRDPEEVTCPANEVQG